LASKDVLAHGTRLLAEDHDAPHYSSAIDRLITRDDAVSALLGRCRSGQLSWADGARKNRQQQGNYAPAGGRQHPRPNT
jgi:hypothetical protein